MRAERKIVQNAVSRRKRHDNKILKSQILLLNNFVVIAAQAPKLGRISLALSSFAWMPRAPKKSQTEVYPVQNWSLEMPQEPPSRPECTAIAAIQ